MSGKRRRARRVADAETATAAAAFLEGQEITRTQCVQCYSEIAGVNGRYACGNCGWVNPWTEGHKPLPTAEDDVQARESDQG